jgi:hypothetical protein
LITSGHAGDQHGDADDEDAYDRGQSDAGKRDDAGEKINYAECHDPAALGAQRLERRTVEGVCI